MQLNWEGRRAVEIPISPPVLHLVEEVKEIREVRENDTVISGEQETDAWRNRLIQGDNRDAMLALRAEYLGQFALIYLDPPFFTGLDFHAALREGETVDGVAVTTPAYTDKWAGELPGYLQWMFERLTLARDLLREDGVIYVHLNWQAVHYVKLLMDEVFGADRFQNEIVWCHREAINSKTRWNRKHDNILFYSKGKRFPFHYDAVREPYAESNIRKYRSRDEKGAYRLMGRGITGSPLRSKRDLPADYEAKYPELTYRHYLGTGILPVDYWNIDIENQASPLRTGYPTQKPEALLERILLASSSVGDLVGDFCCGSGTTLAVAQRLGRRWIGCDAGDVAIQVARQRLMRFTGEEVNRAFRLEQVVAKVAE